MNPYAIDSFNYSATTFANEKLKATITLLIAVKTSQAFTIELTPADVSIWHQLCILSCFPSFLFWLPQAVTSKWIKRHMSEANQA